MFRQFDPKEPQVVPLMERALDLLPDGVLIVGSEREVLYVNAAFERLWRVPHDVVRQGHGAMLRFVAHQMEDPDGFIDLVERLYSSPEASEDQVLFKDGRVFNRRSVALNAGNGSNARIWIFTDVTEARCAWTDPLTGLANRRAYIRDLPEFLASNAEDVIKAFALLDFDHFKDFNDLYGHSAGDEALELLSHLFQAHVNEATDRVYRIGGEEFAITSVHRHREGIARFHDRIRQSVENADITHAGNPPHGAVTVSIGVGIIRGKVDLKTVFRETDDALFRAKKRGRNRIIMVDLNERIDGGETLLIA